MAKCKITIALGDYTLMKTCEYANILPLTLLMHRALSSDLLKGAVCSILNGNLNGLLFSRCKNPSQQIYG